MGRGGFVPVNLYILCNQLNVFTNMNPNELRLNNWIEHNEKGHIQVTELIAGQELNAKPYKLMPMILLGFGFEEIKQYTWVHPSTGFQLVQEKDGSYLQYIDNIKNTVGVPLRYMHELQNRFYSFTGVELTRLKGF